ncbi:MAG: DUF1289 domain-containing protein [Pseudomonadales bacterium]|nr:DUF1289 domain-containing protein [Pseudomonadales bacterium]
MGICSTTYGDLVCRGCKRFAHEVIDWNVYDADQREAIWRRLEGMRGQIVGRVFMIVDIWVYLAFCREQRLPTTIETKALDDVLASLVRNNNKISAAGLALKSDGEIELGSDPDALEVMKRIDVVIYGQALANYERNFRVSSA